MNFNFSDMRVTLVVAPVDMRSGFQRLACIAHSVLGIDVTQKKDAVVFVSKHRAIVKMIWADECGVSMLTRRLNTGRFERFLMKAEGPSTDVLTVEDLFRFLDGTPVYRRRDCLLA